MAKEDFRQVLGKLVTDPSFREAVQADPHILSRDYNLTADEIGTLVSVGAHSTDQAEVQGYNVYCCCCCCF